MLMARPTLKPKPPENNPKNAKNNNLLKNKQILKPKYHLRWQSGFHI